MNLSFLDWPLLVEKGVGFLYLVFGLSLMLQPKFWMDFVEACRKEPSRCLPLVLIGLPLGLSVVLLHNEWSWSPSVFVTLFGWIALLKSSFYLLFPEAFTKLIPKRVVLLKILRFEGPLLVIICLLVLYHAYLN